MSVLNGVKMKKYLDFKIKEKRMPAKKKDLKSKFKFVKFLYPLDKNGCGS